MNFTNFHKDFLAIKIGPFFEFRLEVSCKLLLNNIDIGSSHDNIEKLLMKNLIYN